MARVVTQARVRARDSRKAWLWKRRRPLSFVAAGAVALVVAETFWMLWTGDGGSFTYYMLGATHAGIVLGVLFGVHTVFLLHDSEGANQLRGAWGEDNTREELRMAQRRRVIWGAVHDVRLQVGDLDHVVVTRRGGLVVLDSKWRSKVTDGAADELAARARRVQTRANALVDTLRPRERRARRASGRAGMRCAVVVWGALADALPPDHIVDGVAVVAGQDLRRWLTALEGDPIDKDSAMRFLADVRDFSARVASR